MNKQVVILGAGLAGLNCARNLDKRIGYKIFEKEDRVGGLCRSVEQDGFIFDFTGHLLHLRDQKMFALVRSLLPGNLNSLRRSSWIYSQGVHTRYPFQANTYGLPPKIVRECLLGFIQAQIAGRRPKAGGSFYDWVMNNFGAGIGRYFMFPYNEKLWTLPARELVTDWMGEYVPRPQVPEVITGALTDQTRMFGYNANFWYPRRNGIQSLPDALARPLTSIQLGETAVKINSTEKTVQFASGRTANYQKLVSSMSLVELLAMIENLPARVKRAAALLRYNCVLNINVGVTPDLGTDKHWIYFPEKKYPYYRIGVCSNFTNNNHPPDTSSLYIEISYRPGRKDRQNPTEIRRLVKHCTDSMYRTGLLKANTRVITTKVLNISPAYCLYDLNRRNCLTVIREFLQGQGIYSIGRYGAWEYSAMEEALVAGEYTALRIREELC